MWLRESFFVETAPRISFELHFILQSEMLLLIRSIYVDVFIEYLSQIENESHRSKLENILKWIMASFPTLVPKVAWNQPMFTDHGTFIIGFSAAKQHLAISPERAGMQHFSEEIKLVGYEYSKMLIRIKWTDPVNYDFLKKVIEFNMADKADCSLFWRK